MQMQTVEICAEKLRPIIDEEFGGNVKTCKLIFVSCNHYPACCCLHVLDFNSMLMEQ